MPLIPPTTTARSHPPNHALPPGTAAVQDDHYDLPPPAPDRGPSPKQTVEQQFCALGPEAEAFLVGAAKIGNTRLGSELEILFALTSPSGDSATYHRSAVLARSEPNLQSESTFHKLTTSRPAVFPSKDSGLTACLHRGYVRTGCHRVIGYLGQGTVPISFDTPSVCDAALKPGSTNFRIGGTV